jgi:hypothetical protein
MVLPVEYLRSVGAVPMPVSVIVEDPVEELVATYRHYLADERGLARSTIEQYERIGSLFLPDQTGPPRDRARPLACSRRDHIRRTRLLSP